LTHVATARSCSASSWSGSSRSCSGWGPVPPPRWPGCGPCLTGCSCPPRSGPVLARLRPVVAWLRPVLTPAGAKAARERRLAAHGNQPPPTGLRAWLRPAVTRLGPAASWLRPVLAVAGAVAIVVAACSPSARHAARHPDQPEPGSPTRACPRTSRVAGHLARPHLDSCRRTNRPPRRPARPVRRPGAVARPPPPEATPGASTSSPVSTPTETVFANLNARRHCFAHRVAQRHRGGRRGRRGRHAQGGEEKRRRPACRPAPSQRPRRPPSQRPRRPRRHRASRHWASPLLTWPIDRAPPTAPTGSAGPTRRLPRPWTSGARWGPGAPRNSAG